jgi:alkanesulfonate monooxygenase SsuD/methylene tetrahydromethanopterin reductase-like flavin-dependent oxidoreductase (luciferase family)
VKIGLFLLSPQRHPAKAPDTVLRETIEIACAAEALDFDSVWIAEHHFANLSLSPSPLLTLSHLAARTSRIRLGTGVLVLPLYQPMRLAEEIAYVDVVSGGRLEIGIGSGSQVHESRAFETRIEDANQRFNEVLDVLEMAFDRGEVDHHGRHFEIPHTPMSVQPMQRPHPPFYIAGLSGDATVTRRIARRGYTAFCSLFGPPDGEPARKRAQYAQGYVDEGLDPASLRFAAQRLVYVTDDPADARDAAEQALYTIRAVSTVKGPDAEFDGPIIRARPLPQEPDLETFLDRMMIGSAAKVTEMIAADIEHLAPVHFNCFMQFGAIDGQRTIRSMERFMREVAPALNGARAGAPLGR